MKLKSIKIRNFKSHENTEIKLDSGVNVIVGVSDVGKSSIMQAIQWVLTNKPSGDSFVSEWNDKNTFVKLEFEDGTITRIRKPTFNGYILNKQKYKGFGQKIPDEIVDFLNVNSINIQSSQFESPFLLDLTPGERGVFLNKLVDLEITDTAISNIKSTLQKEKSRISSLSSDIELLEEEEKNYVYLDDMEQDIIDLEVKNKQFENNELKIKKLECLVEDILIVEREIERVQHVKEIKKKTDLIENKIEELKQKNEKLFVLRNLLKRILKEEQEIKKLKKTTNVKGLVVKVESAIGKQDKVANIARQLQNLVYLINKKVGSITKLRTEIEKNKSWFEQHMPKQCPLCGR